ncbi:MAG: NfeD family protein [Burkholderiaceae bacterium]|nr:NfeD family protein [Burkholderiaceae bacterium]
MSDWSFWLWAAGVTVVLELLTGTFYLLMIAIGLAAGALAAVAGGALVAQTLVAAVVGVLATGLLWRSKAGRPQTVDAAIDPNVNMDIGQTVKVADWQNGTARVMYRGALWDVELAAGSPPAAGVYTIREVRGSRLIVGA